MCKFRSVDLNFDSYCESSIFSDWLADMKCYFDCYEMPDVSKIQFAGIRLVKPARIY